LELKYKLNALAALALAVAFALFFLYTKHDPALAAILPFAEDPYDSLGRFCTVVSFLLAVLALVRAFRPYEAGQSTAVHRVFLARTEAAVALGVLATLAGDLIAMARHASVWFGKPSWVELAGLMAGLAAFSLAFLFRVRLTRRRLKLPVVPNRSRNALIVLLVFVVVLAIFPEDMVQTVFPHLVAIVLGFILVAAPQAAFAVALLPYQTDEAKTVSERQLPRIRLWVQWGAVALLGFAIGGVILLRDIFGEGAGNAPLQQVVIVSAVFIGAGISALLVAFGFLKKPLGLFRGL
jgi:uncharacterized membrane protein YidH (DUF202 family)